MIFAFRKYVWYHNFPTIFSTTEDLGIFVKSESLKKKAASHRCFLTIWTVTFSCLQWTLLWEIWVMRWIMTLLHQQSKRNILKENPSNILVKYVTSYFPIRGTWKSTWQFILIENLFRAICVTNHFLNQDRWSSIKTCTKIMFHLFLVTSVTKHFHRKQNLSFTKKPT